MKYGGAVASAFVCSSGNYVGRMFAIFDAANMDTRHPARQGGSAIPDAAIRLYTGKILERNRSSSRSRAAMMPQSKTAHTKAQSEPKASGVARIINTPPEYIGWRTMR